MDSDNILKAFGHLGIKVPTYQVPEIGNFSVSCPFAPYDDQHKSNKDEKPSCSVLVDPIKVSLFQCWTCKRRGSVVWMASELNKLGAFSADVVEAIRDLEVAKLEKVGVNRVRDEKWRKQVDGIAWGEVPLYITRDRGVPLEICKEWNLGYDHALSRVVFPVWNRWDELVGMVGRTMDPNSKKKYPAYPGFDKNSHLYGAQLLKPGVSKKVVLVEGMLDVLQAYSFRILDQYVTLGLMGVYLLPGQRELLKSWADEVYLMLDADTAGQRETQAILDNIRPILPVRIPVLPDGKKDPKELEKDEYLFSLQNAKSPELAWGS